MKNITKSIIALFAILALSCTVEDVQDRPVIVGTDAAVLTAPLSGATYVLLFDNASAQVERFTWTSANYAGDIQVTYAVEIDKKGNTFKTPQTLGSVISGNQVSVTVEQMNNALKALKATPLAAAQFEIRVKSTSGATEPMYSNVNTINVTPYSTDIPKLAVPGDHQGANWNPATAPLLAATKFGNTDFEGYLWLEGKFKFVASDAAGAFAWGNTDYGDDGTFSGVLKAENESDCSATAGYYLVKADTKLLTYSATKTDWAITGSGTPNGWPDNGVQDHNMTYNAVAKTWTITLALSANEIKFRANDAWAINYGDTGADGKLEQGSNDNIKVPSAGTYLVTLDLSNPRAYTYTLVKQ